jgi:hypothetical protein
MKQQLYTLDYKQSRFQFPNFTKNAKSDTDTVCFFNCDFSAVQNINLSGFKSVVFIGYDTIFRPQSKIQITDCDKIKFKQVIFESNQSTHITGAKSVMFDTIDFGSELKLQTQNCDYICCSNSTLNFDTSNMHAKEFRALRSEIARIKTLDLTGITKEVDILVSINPTDLKEIILRPGISSSITFKGNHILESSIIRFQER